MVRERTLSLLEEDRHLVLTHPPPQSRPCERKTIRIEEAVSAIMKSSSHLSPHIRSGSGNGSPSTKRKLSYIICDEDEGRIRIGGEELINPFHSDSIADCDSMVDRYLLYKYAWQLLRQLYINASSKRMRMMASSISDKKSEQKLFRLLKTRTEFTRRLIISAYIGELKLLKRLWSLFTCKLVAYRQESIFNSVTRRTVVCYYLQKEGGKVFSLLRKGVIYQQNVLRPAVNYFEVRGLRNALLCLKCHARACRNDSRNDRKNDSRNDTREGTKNSRNGSRKSRKGGMSLELNLWGDNYQRGRCLSLREMRVTGTVDRLHTMRHQELESSAYMNMRCLLRGIRGLCGAADRSRDRRESDEYVVNYNIQYTAMKALNIWLYRHDNIILDNEGDDLADSHAYSYMTKTALSLWVKTRRSSENFRSLVNSSITNYRRRSALRCLRIWRFMLNAHNAQYSRCLVGANHCLSKAFKLFKIKINEYGKHSLKLRKAAMDSKVNSFRILKYWEILSTAVRYRTLRRKTKYLVVEFRRKCLLREGFRSILCVYSESVSKLRDVREKNIVRAKRKIIQCLYLNKSYRIGGRGRNVLLGAYVVKKALQRTFYFLLRLSLTAMKEREIKDENNKKKGGKEENKNENEKKNEKKDTKNRIRSNERRQSEIFLETAAIAQLNRAAPHRHHHHTTRTLQHWVATTRENIVTKNYLEEVVRTCHLAFLKRCFQMFSDQIRIIRDLNEKSEYGEELLYGKRIRNGFEGFIRLHFLSSAVKIGRECFFLRKCGESVSSWKRFAVIKSNENYQEISAKKYKEIRLLKGTLITLHEYNQNKQKYRIKSEEYSNVRNKYTLRNAVRILRSFKTIRKAYFQVQNIILRKFSCIWTQKCYLRKISRNIIQDCLKRWRFRNYFRYFSSCVENTKIERKLEKKIFVKKNGKKLKFFDTWCKVMNRKNDQMNLMQSIVTSRMEGLEKNVIHALLRNIEKKYEVSDIMKASEMHYNQYQKCIVFNNLIYLLRNRRARDFHLKQRFISFVRRLFIIRVGRARDNMSMKIGNKVVVRKLFSRWKMRCFGDGDDLNGSDDKNRSNHNNNLNNNLNNNQNNRYDSKCKNNSNNNNDIDSCIISNNNINNGSNKIRLKKSRHALQAKQYPITLVLSRRSQQMLSQSILSLYHCSVHAKKMRRYILNCENHRWDFLKHSVFRALLTIIRRRHKNNRQNIAHERLLRYSILYRHFSHFERCLTDRWTDSQRLRIAAVHARSTALRRGLKKILVNSLNK